MLSSSVLLNTLHVNAKSSCFKLSFCGCLKASKLLISLTKLLTVLKKWAYSVATSLFNIYLCCLFRQDTANSTPLMCRTPDSFFSTGSGLTNFSQFSNPAANFKLPEKLQIVKPLEGEWTLLRAMCLCNFCSSLLSATTLTTYDFGYVYR